MPTCTEDRPADLDYIPSCQEYMPACTFTYLCVQCITTCTSVCQRVFIIYRRVLSIYPRVLSMRQSVQQTLGVQQYDIETMLYGNQTLITIVVDIYIYIVKNTIITLYI